MTDEVRVFLAGLRHVDGAQPDALDGIRVIDWLNLPIEGDPASSRVAVPAIARRRKVEAARRAIRDLSKTGSFRFLAEAKQLQAVNEALYKLHPSLTVARTTFREAMKAEGLLK